MTNPRIAYQMSRTRKRLSPPDGKPLIVHLVVNVEHWRFAHAMPTASISSTPKNAGTTLQTQDMRPIDRETL